MGSQQGLPMDQNGRESNNNEGVFHTPYRFKNGASPSDAVYRSEFKPWLRKILDADFHSYMVSSNK